MRERETECKWGRGREQRRHLESEADSRLWAVSTEPDTGLEPMNHEIMTWAKVGRLTDWVTQAPQNLNFFLIFIVFETQLIYVFYLFIYETQFIVFETLTGCPMNWVLKLSAPWTGAPGASWTGYWNFKRIAPQVEYLISISKNCNRRTLHLIPTFPAFFYGWT